MKRGTTVKLEKLQASPAAILPSPSMKDYKPGEVHYGVSIPVGYSMEGILLRDVEIGQPLLMERHKRNDVVVFGMTETSAIMAIQGDILLTQNSVYRMTVLNVL
jgi:hypothetical protein